MNPARDDLPTLVAPSSGAATAFDAAAPLAQELERQVQVYVDLRVHELLGLDEEGLRGLLAPLGDCLPTEPPEPWGDAEGHPTVADDDVPFVLVLPGVDVLDLVPAMRRGSRPGVSMIDRDETATFRPLPGLYVPDAPYLLLGVDVGSRFCGVTPEKALTVVTGNGRTPLTMAEGVALAVVRPDRLRPNRCWSLMGSRTGTNQRVPAVWISEKAAKLGWCWDRNPHTWLGAASALRRA